MTTTPAPKDTATPADAPFDPLDFPKDLLDAQLREATLYAELHALRCWAPMTTPPCSSPGTSLSPERTASTPA